MVVDLGALGVDLGAPVRREHESGWATAPAELYTIIPVGVALRAPPDTPPLAAAMLKLYGILFNWPFQTPNRCV